MSEKNFKNDLIDRTLGNIVDGKLELIDFDQLYFDLQELNLQRMDHQLDSYELDALKKEYASRIIGMLKANLATRPNDNEERLAVHLSGDLTKISSLELIGYYKKAASRFRDNFPSSFRYVGYSGATVNRKNWNEHKI